MAGMFYSLEEVTSKLGKSEADVKDLVKEGKLREFRDGSKVLFKIEEVDALAAKSDGIDLSAADEIAKADIASSGMDIDLALDETGDITLEVDSGASSDDPLADFDLTSLGDLTGIDTSVGTTSGISVLAESDADYKLAGDTKGETVADEDSADVLGSLDDDVNMESFGSGSGLLDLSLQADDTSLGAVLDDILPTAGEGESDGLIGDDISLSDDGDMFEQPEEAVEVASDRSPVVSPAAIPAGRVGVSYIEAEPTSVDNACGISLFAALLAVVFTAIIITAGMKGFAPAILKAVAKPSIAGLPLMWLIVVGLVVLVLFIILIAALVGGKKSKQASNAFQQPA